MTFVKTYKLFKARGIRIESANGCDIGSLFSAKDMYEQIEKLKKEYAEREKNKQQD